MDHNQNDRRATNDHDRGQAVGLVAMAIALIGMISIGIASAATRLTDRSRAQNAADAAALAGVGGGASAAAAVAARNGAVMTSFTVTAGSALGTTVTVEVMLGDEHAIARASDEP